MPICGDFAALLHASRDGLLILDAEGVCLEANEAAGALFRRSPSALRGRSIGELAPALANAWDVLREGAPSATAAIAFPDGAETPLEITLHEGVVREAHLVTLHDLTDATARRDAEERYGASIARDIAGRERAHERLEASEHHFRALIEHASDIIAVIEAGGVIRYVSPAVERILGLAPAEVRGRPAVEFIHPDDRAAAAQSIARRFAQPDGPWVTEFRFRHRDGGWRLLQTRATVYERGGAPDELILSARDVTELKQLEEQLHQSQKMEAIGRLSAGVAHDFNNLLTVIGGYAELLLGGMRETDPAHPLAQEILLAGERATALTRQLLAFSRKQVLAPGVLDLNQILREMRGMLARLLGDDVRVVTKLQEGLGAVRADPGQIEQVVMNLAVNARDAMAEGGTLILETRDVELGAEHTATRPGLPPGDYVLLAATDTGKGMDAETASHVFEPFFTTKERGTGTGLGLATVYGIVKQTGGDILVYSVPGRGTTFKVFLPMVHAEGGHPPRRVSSGIVPARGAETVLLVEDDATVRRLTASILESLGYTVLAAADPEAAITLASGHPGEIHALVSDVLMPGMNGPTLAEAVSCVRPGLPVLFVSGYSDEAVVYQGLLREGAVFLQKPFSPASLSRKLREAIDQKGEGSPFAGRTGGEVEE